MHHANLHVLQDDLDRCRALGMNAYRFSVEWSRIEPHPGDLRADVLENYYVQVVREIKARHMEPVLTLQHMTLLRWVLTPSNVNQTLVQAAAKSVATTGLALAALLAFRGTGGAWSGGVQAPNGRGEPGLPAFAARLGVGRDGRPLYCLRLLRGGPITR